MKPSLSAVHVVRLLTVAIVSAALAPAQATGEDLKRLSDAHRLQRAGRHTEALAVLDGLGPGLARWSEVPWMKAYSHFELDDLTRARDHAIEAVALGRLSRDVLSLLLQIDRRRGDDLAALHWAEWLHSLEPDADWLLVTGDILAASGREEGADSVYRALLRADPARADLWTRLGNLGLRDDDPAFAAECYETAWWAGERTSGLAANLSGLWQRMGDHRAALLWLERGMELEGTPTAETELRRAQLLLAVGDVGAAEEAAARLADREDPRIACRARDVLGRAAYARGDLAIAAGHWERVVACDPEDVSVCLLLGKLFYTLEAHGDAAGYLERYVMDPRVHASEEEWRLLLRSVVRADSAPERAPTVLSAYVERFGLDADARAALRHCVDRGL